MSGLINVTGARSGIIGTTVGTPAGAPDPAVDGFWGYLTGDVSYPSTTTVDINEWSASRAFLGSAVSESGGVITIGTAGWYSVGFRLTCDNNSTASQVWSLRFNNVVMSRIWNCIHFGASGFNGPLGSGNVIVELAADTAIKIDGQGALQGAGNSGNINDAETMMWGHRISD